MPLNYVELYQTLKTSVSGLAKESVSNYVEEATSDGNSIITGLKTQIEDYSQMLINKEIDEANFRSLILGEKDLLKM